MTNLDGKTAIVTGASAGIGAATALALHAAGARLVITARRRDRLDAIASKTGAVVVDGDITDEAVRDRVVDAAGEAPAVLVNNAGYAEPGPVERVSLDDARHQFEVNVFAAADLATKVMPAMRRARSGRIINVSSVAGRVGYPLFGWYCASKHALEGLSDAMRMELAPFGVKVVLIEPGPVRTEFFDVSMRHAAPHKDDAESPYGELFENQDEIEAEFLQHAAAPEEVAEVIVKAATAARPKSRYAVTKIAKLTMLSLRLLPRSALDKAFKRQFRLPDRM
ncbi:MAG: SDR family NAD(P)-dependent oxidoreductase [Planctomycetota bacterium]